MPTHYGYHAARGGFSYTLNGRQGIAWNSKKHEIAQPLDYLASGGPELDSHDESRKGLGEGAPAVGALVNEISIEGISREAQRLVGGKPADLSTSTAPAMDDLIKEGPSKSSGGVSMRVVGY